MPGHYDLKWPRWTASYGPFDLIVSALAVHHLDGSGKADLLPRLAAVLPPGGRIVIADVVVPAG